MGPNKSKFKKIVAGKSTSATHKKTPEKPVKRTPKRQPSKTVLKKVKPKPKTIVKETPKEKPVPEQFPVSPIAPEETGLELVKRKEELQLDKGLFFMLPGGCDVFENLAPVRGGDGVVSELSLPFSEISDLSDDKNSRREEYSRTTNQDYHHVFPFSQNFKTTINETKKEMPEKSKTMMAETMEMIVVGSKEPIRYKIPVPIQRKVVRLLNDKSFRISPDSSEVSDQEEETPDKPVEEQVDTSFDAKKNWSDLKDDVIGRGRKSILAEVRKLTRRERKKAKSKKQAPIIPIDEEAYDTMSGYWRILSAFDEFKISPPVYDAYRQEEGHWLQTKPMSYHVYENSRNKCLDWLRKHFAVY